MVNIFLINPIPILEGELFDILKYGKQEEQTKG
jgi:hypothetical protein